MKIQLPFSKESVRVDDTIIEFPNWIRQLVDTHIYPNFHQVSFKYFQEERYKRCFYILLTNLYQASNLKLPIRFYRGPNYYHKRNIVNENQMAFTASRVCKCIDYLSDNEYTSIHIGREGIKNQYSGYMSQAYCLSRLYKLFRKYENKNDVCKYSLRPPSVIIKNDDKVLLDPLSNKVELCNQTVADLMIEMDTINDFYNNTIIELDLRHVDLLLKEKNILKYMLHRNMLKQTYPNFFRLEKKTCRRIFNNSSYKCGGRVYGMWQNVTSRLRQFLLINHSSTIELDFKACQPTMLYHMKGIDYTDDPYHIDEEIFKGECIRGIHKLILLIILNSANINAATKALKDRLFEDDYGIFNYHKLKRWIERFVEKHDLISEYFFTGVGLQLQRLESDIAIKTILDLKSLNIPCLSIHDGFVIPSDNEQICRYLLTKNYNKIFPKFKPTIKLENF